MRREPTPPEKYLWRNLSGSRLGGYKFRRHAALPPFIADFLCPAKGLVIEVDGETHEARSDARRDAALAAQGFSTIRFTNIDVLTNIDGVLTTILQRLQSMPDRWDRTCTGPDYRPHPNPSPEGEGL
jgi:very-short-patch-repair endonuclease